MWKSLIIYSLAAITSTHAGCNWCRPPDIVACGATTTNDWTLVRAIGPNKGSWFNNRDNLQGTDQRVDNNADQFNIGSFETAVPGFNQYLFVTGDCSLFLTTSKNAVNGQYYGRAQRDICSSSERDTPYTAAWYNRNNCCVEDPWISTIDHDAAVGAGKLVYGENNFGGPHAGNVVGPKKGVYVFIRNAGRLDANGCAQRRVREYIVKNQKTTGQDAERICQREFSSTLATVISEQDYQQMAKAKAAAGVPVAESVWVGLSDRYGEDNFEWDDGTQCENNNGDCIRSNNDPSPQWGRGEPNNAALSTDGSGEDCVEFYNSFQDRPWFNDLPCKEGAWARNVACNKPKPCVPITEGRSGIMSGDPHFVTFNHVSHHFQGPINTAGEEQFYLSTACDVNNRNIQPFSVLATLREFPNSRVTLLEYITIALYDYDDETYYLFATTSAGKNKYGKASDGIKSTLYDSNAANLKPYARGRTRIGSRFEIEYIYIDAHRFRINLFIKEGQKTCQINIFMQTQWIAPNDEFRMHFFEMQPPQCYKCTTCGLLGDFQTPNGQPSILRCDGKREDISGARHWLPGAIGYDATGWSWNKKYVDDGCRGGRTEPVSREIAACKDNIQVQAKSACQEARDIQNKCCNTNDDIHEFCEDLKEDCVIDACIAQQLGTHIGDTVRNEFTLPVVSECQRLGIATANSGLFNFDIDNDNEYVYDVNGNTIHISSIFLYILAGLLTLNIICCAVSCQKRSNKKIRYKVVSIDSTDADTDAENRVLVK